MNFRRVGIFSVVSMCLLLLLLYSIMPIQNSVNRIFSGRTRQSRYSPGHISLQAYQLHDRKSILVPLPGHSTIWYQDAFCFYYYYYFLNYYFILGHKKGKYSESNFLNVYCNIFLHLLKKIIKYEYDGIFIYM